MFCASVNGGLSGTAYGVSIVFLLVPMLRKAWLTPRIGHSCVTRADVLVAVASPACFLFLLGLHRTRVELTACACFVMYHALAEMLLAVCNAQVALAWVHVTAPPPPGPEHPTADSDDLQEPLFSHEASTLTAPPLPRFGPLLTITQGLAFVILDAFQGAFRHADLPSIFQTLSWCLIPLAVVSVVRVVVLSCKPYQLRSLPVRQPLCQ